MAGNARSLRASHRDSPSPSRASQKRSTRKLISYKEDSSEDSGDERFSPVSEDDAPPLKRQRRAIASRSSRPQRASAHTVSAKHGSQYRARPTASSSSTTRLWNESKKIHIESDGVIPVWRTLPYEILLDIFSYAFDSLRNDDLSPKKAISWTMDTACVCKAFTEAALSALYRDPPLLNRSQPHKLLNLLTTYDKHSSNLSLDYGVKIKRLELDVGSTLAYKLHNHGILDLGKLVSYLPQLSELDIYLWDDLPPYRQGDHSVRWHYPDNLFSALVSTQQHLKSFRWNFRLFGDRHALSWMSEIHKTKPFQSLRHVTISNFLLNHKDNGSTEAEESLAANCAALPQLESIYLQSSPNVNGPLLKGLPQTLNRLKLENCVNLTSDALYNFLESHGLHLKELVLNHNQALDLAFLPSLARTVPGLELLKMDMNYYNSHVTHRDSNPLYDALLASDEIPTWPQTLRTVDMVHLRKWEELQAATHFFQSLIDSAKDLPDLRKLVLKVILDSSWRERADFREKWIPRFQGVFLRKTDPPNSNLASLRAFRRWKNQESLAERLSESQTDMNLLSGRDSGSRSSRLDHVEIPRRAQMPEHAGPSSRTRQSQRIAQVDSSSENVHSEEENKSDDDVVQGMCQIVDILIDNQRPREALFNEEDFVDSEASGDEDWTGEDDAVPDDGYAW